MARSELADALARAIAAREASSLRRPKPRRAGC